MTVLTPVILAGGRGTRLWPTSRETYPKQFVDLVSEKTLFQLSAERLQSSSVIKFNKPITLTNERFRFIVTEQLLKISVDPGPIIIEPEGKNTAAAILSASIFALKRDPNAIIFVTPSDHVIPDVSQFHAAILKGLPAASEGKIVTFGICPSRPEVGYGYIELDEEYFNLDQPNNVCGFIEKPSFDVANQLCAKKNFLWNAGIFLFRACDMVKAFAKFQPNIFDLVSQSINEATFDLGFVRPGSGCWAQLPDISIDYAIMEKADNLVAVPLHSHWSDLGGWDAIWLESEKDNDGNVKSKQAHVFDCNNSLIRSESPHQQVVGIGLDSIIAIAMPDAVLVAHKDYAQNIKEAVSHLKKLGVVQAEVMPTDHRPWGWFESLAVGEFFQVKRIHVNPGAALSLQSHKHRSEHWIVVAGEAKITIDGNVETLTAGQSTYVPLGSIHRMENTKEYAMELIEVQIGSYLGEDDIVRYEDIYSRD